jgi:hypothetical protein
MGYRGGRAQRTWTCTHSYLHLEGVARAISPRRPWGDIEALLGAAIRVLFELVAMLERVAGRRRPVRLAIHGNRSWTSVVHRVTLEVVVV